MSSHIEVFANAFQITRFVTIYPELFPAPDTYLALSNWITSSSRTIEHMAVLKPDLQKVNVCGVYALLSSHFLLAHHWCTDIPNFLLKRKENNFYPLCNSFIIGWAFSSAWIYFYWSGALMVVQSQIPAMTENMPSHVFEYIEASLTLCTPRLDDFSSDIQLLIC